jgi:hypothetical protein
VHFRALIPFPIKNIALDFAELERSDSRAKSEPLVSELIFIFRIGKYLAIVLYRIGTLPRSETPTPHELGTSLYYIIFFFFRI